MYPRRWRFDRAGLKIFVGLIDAKPLEYKPSAFAFILAVLLSNRFQVFSAPPARKRLNNARTNPFSSFPDADLC